MQDSTKPTATRIALLSFLTCTLLIMTLSQLPGSKTQLNTNPIYQGKIPTCAADSPIYIFGNDQLAAAASPAGTGEEGNPYIIENKNITAGGSHLITIISTDKFFELRNCELSGGPQCAIYMRNVTNGLVKNITMHNNQRGILINNCTMVIQNCTVYGMTQTGMLVEDDSRAIIQNCSVHNNGAKGSTWGGMYLGGSYTVVENCHVYENAPNGIMVNGHHNRIQHSRVENNHYEYEDVEIFGEWNTLYNTTIDSNGWACALISCHNSTIESNTILGGNLGLWIEESRNNKIMHNYFNGSSGLMNCIDVCRNSYDTYIFNNTCWDPASHGIQAEDTIYNCTIENNTVYSAGWMGIIIAGSNFRIIGNNVSSGWSEGAMLASGINLTIQDNYIHDSPHGLKLSGVTFSRILNNLICQNAGNGMYLDTSSNNNTIQYNKIINNGGRNLLLTDSQSNIVTHNDVQNSGSNPPILETGSCWNNTIQNNLGMENGPVVYEISPTIDTDGTIQLSWEPLAWATIYYVYCSSIAITSVTGLQPIGETGTTSYTDSISIDGTYYYVIVGGNSVQNSTVSNCVSVVVQNETGGGGNGTDEGVPGFPWVFLFLGGLLGMLGFLKKKVIISHQG